MRFRTREVEIKLRYVREREVEDRISLGSGG